MTTDIDALIARAYRLLQSSPFLEDEAAILIEQLIDALREMRNRVSALENELRWERMNDD